MKLSINQKIIIHLNVEYIKYNNAHALGITFKRLNASFSNHSLWSGWAMLIKACARCLKLFPNNEATPNSVTI